MASRSQPVLKPRAQVVWALGAAAERRVLDRRGSASPLVLFSSAGSVSASSARGPRGGAGCAGRARPPLSRPSSPDGDGWRRGATPGACAWLQPPARFHLRAIGCKEPDVPRGRSVQSLGVIETLHFIAWFFLFSAEASSPLWSMPLPRWSLCCPPVRYRLPRCTLTDPDTPLTCPLNLEWLLCTPFPPPLGAFLSRLQIQNLAKKLRMPPRCYLPP